MQKFSKNPHITMIPMRPWDQETGDTGSYYCVIIFLNWGNYPVFATIEIMWEMMWGICEGYVRDSEYPSHPTAPLYKGISEENVRDEGFLHENYSRRIEEYCNPSTRILQSLQENTAMILPSYSQIPASSFSTKAYFQNLNKFFLQKRPI